MQIVVTGYQDIWYIGATSDQ